VLDALMAKAEKLASRCSSLRTWLMSLKVSKKRERAISTTWVNKDADVVRKSKSQKKS